MSAVDEWTVDEIESLFSRCLWCNEVIERHSETHIQLRLVNGDPLDRYDRPAHFNCLRAAVTLLSVHPADVARRKRLDAPGGSKS